MRSLLAVLGFVVVFSTVGCGGYNRYPDSDVAEVPDLKLTGANGIKKSGGILFEGTLTYEGRGDLHEIYREFLMAMKEMGWTSGRDKIEGNTASGSLHKENRTCNVDMVDENRNIKATLKIGSSQ